MDQTSLDKWLKAILVFLEFLIQQLTLKKLLHHGLIEKDLQK